VEEVVVVLDGCSLDVAMVDELFSGGLREEDFGDMIVVIGVVLVLLSLYVLVVEIDVGVYGID
jgi:hypothetical protein